MVKVNASLVFKGNESMPSDVPIDIPIECCNRESFNGFVKDTLLSMLKERATIKYDYIRGDSSSCNGISDNDSVAEGTEFSR